jgi:DNA-binding GntR family transcriptional regulator
VSSANKSVEIVLDELKRGIQHGRYVPGQRLVTSDLATQLGTSLAPVKEALHILAGEGLVELQPHKGARVRTLTAQTFIDGLEVLEVVGALGLRLFAPRLEDPVVAAQIPRIAAEIADGGKRRNPHTFFTAIARSHRFVNDHSGNSYLNAIIERIHLEYFYRQMAEYLPDDFWEPYLENYDRIGALLAQRDVRAAERAWVSHVRWVISLIRKRKAEQERASAPRRR